MTQICNDRGRAIIKSAESLRLMAYQDTGDVWTIGWGHTHGVKPSDTCDEAQAQRWFDEDVASAEDAVRNIIHVPLNDNQFSALVSFAFNVGFVRFAKSTLAAQLNAGDYTAPRREMPKWKFDNGNIQPGLVKRRATELALFNTGEET